jgi:hypothetical protein
MHVIIYRPSLFLIHESSDIIKICTVQTLRKLLIIILPHGVSIDSGWN